MEKVINAIIEHTALSEGFSARVYKCPAGFDTIGYGRNIEANPLTKQEKSQLRSDGSIDKEVALNWLRINLEKCYKELDSTFSFFKDLDLVKKAVLVDLDYNMGIGTLKTFKNTLKHFENNNKDGIVAGLTNSRWYKQVGNRGKRIISFLESGKISV